MNISSHIFKSSVAVTESYFSATSTYFYPLSFDIEFDERMVSYFKVAFASSFNIVPVYELGTKILSV